MVQSEVKHFIDVRHGGVITSVPGFISLFRNFPPEVVGTKNNNFTCH